MSRLLGVVPGSLSLLALAQAISLSYGSGHRFITYLFWWVLTALLAGIALAYSLWRFRVSKRAGREPTHPKIQTISTMPCTRARLRVRRRLALRQLHHPVRAAISGSGPLRTRFRSSKQTNSSWLCRPRRGASVGGWELLLANRCSTSLLTGIDMRLEKLLTALTLRARFFGSDFVIPRGDLRGRWLKWSHQRSKRATTCLR